MWKHKLNPLGVTWVSERNFTSPFAVILVFALLPLVGCNEEPTGPASDPESYAKSASHLSIVGDGDTGFDDDWDGVLLSEFPIDRQREKLETGTFAVEEQKVSSAQAITVIDFETPDLGTSESMVINPYIDASTGVMFTTEAVGVVGLVTNSFTSACVDPPDDNQKLATGVNSIVGRSGFLIQATFPDELPAGTTVSMEVQALEGGVVRVELFDGSFLPVGLVDEVLEPGIGTCGYPGALRARKVVSVTSIGPVKHVTVDIPNQGYVFVIDDFSFGIDSHYTLDIRPGSCPNPLNPVSRGVLPVAIVGSEGADVSEIDVATVHLEGVVPLRSGTEDVATPASGEGCECNTEGPDGYQDLTLKFATQDIVAALGFVPAFEVRTLTLTGNLLDGTPFEISDCIRVVGGRGQSQVFEAQ